MTGPETSMRMAHVALTVTFDEFDRVSDFYRDVFGWRTEREHNGAFGRHRFLTDGHGSHIELVARNVVERPRPTPEPPGHICFAVPDEELDAVLQRARDAGIEVAVPNVSTPELRNETDTRTGVPRTSAWISRYVFFDDPSGNCIEVSSGAYRVMMSGSATGSPVEEGKDARGSDRQSGRRDPER
jgi:catechol 2,3-dioxygenase-like lactoylglutathione lyase family enzyme